MLVLGHVQRSQNAVMFQNMIDTMYHTFLSRVAQGRGMTIDAVHEIAQGRVWTGADAKANGLVDEFGDLDAAIAEAKSQANLEKAKIVEYPKVKSKIERLMEDLTGKKVSASFREQMIKEELGDLAPVYLELKELKEMKGIQMRLPVGAGTFQKF